MSRPLNAPSLRAAAGQRDRHPESAGAGPAIRRRYRLAQRLALALVRACGAASMLLGAVVLWAWVTGVPRIKSLLPGVVEMKANTALALVLAGLALLLLKFHSASPAARRRNRSAQAVGALVATIGLATGAEYVFGWNLGIDEALVPDPGSPSVRGRMSPYTAAALACLGAALVLVPVRRWQRLATLLSGLPMLMGLASLLSYAWEVPELVTDRWAPPVALHTALALLLLGLGALVMAFSSLRGPGRLRLLLDPVEVRVLLGFGGALLALLILWGLLDRAAQQYSLHAAQLAQHETLRSKLSEFYVDAADVAFAQRTFLVTGDPAHARWWLASVKRLAHTRSEMKAMLLQVEPAERQVYAPMDLAVADLLEVLHEGVRIHREQGRAAARAFVASGLCTAAMANVREVLLLADQAERHQEATHQAAVGQSRRRSILIILLALVAAAAVLAGVFMAIRREMAARSSAARTLRRRTSEATGAHRFLESVLQNLPHMIFVKDAAQLRFVHLNRAGEELTGLRRDEIAGKTDRDLFPPEEADFFMAEDREVLERGEVLDIPEGKFLSSHNGVRLLHTRKIPLLDEAGRPTHLVGISEDVTEAKEQEQQIRLLSDALQARADELERMNRAKSIFLATMSHEIRTPMNGMLGMLELLSLGPLASDQRQRLDVVSESGRSLLRIIDDILDFSKIEADKLELREEVVSIAAIVQEICNIHSVVASSKGLVLTSAVDPALSPAGWVDGIRLRQILNNFVSNAVKFTARGRVAIRAEVLAQHGDTQSIRLSVSDTGPGISADDQARLFSLFVQVGLEGRHAAGGTGLGLVIARRLVELMGGSIIVDSAVGEGTTMRFDIDVRSAPPGLLPEVVSRRNAQLLQLAAGMRRAPHAAQAEAEGTLVLVVDDHPVNRSLMQQQLETLGYASVAASDGNEGLEQFRTGRFGLVLTDCQMPVMDGYELARRIRQVEAQAGSAGSGRRMPIVACTAMALPGEVQKCLDAGMDECVIKPVQLLEMREKLQKWLPLPASAAAGDAGVARPSERVAARTGLDRALLEATWGADPARIGDILVAYTRSLRADCAALREAVARHEPEAVMECTHRMLGASRIVGACGVAEACTLVNAASRDDSWSDVLRAMEAFDAEYALLSAELDGRRHVQ